MTSPELRRWPEAIRLGWYEYRAGNPPIVFASALIPRVVLQTVFFTVLGGVVAGPGHRAYSLAGALALALTVTNVVGISTVLSADKQSGTFWRIRTGRLPIAVVLFARAVPYPLAGFVLLIVNIAVVAPVTGLTGLALRIVPLLWLYALMSVTVAAVGMAAAAFSVGKRADTLVTNVTSYLIMLCSGALLPPGRLGWADAIGSVLPIRNGLAAVRAALAGEPWLAHLAMELLVGGAWAGIAIGVITFQARRARRTGHDDFE